MAEGVLRRGRPRGGSSRSVYLVINLGGCETPAGPEPENFAYAEFILRGVLQSNTPQTTAGPITLLAGHHAIAHLRTTFPDCGSIALHTATHDYALDLLGTAARVLTSPGLTTTLECFQFAAPTYFLPPQNYSQWRILESLRAAGLATGSFAWSDAMGTAPDLATMPEKDRTPFVRNIIAQAGAIPATSQLFAASLRDWIASDSTALATRQRQFFESLGPNGVDTIAGELIRIYQ